MYSQVTFPDPVALILGNELTGIDVEVMDECDKLIEIPTFGVKVSIKPPPHSSLLACSFTATPLCRKSSVSVCVYTHICMYICVYVYQANPLWPNLQLIAISRQPAIPCTLCPFVSICIGACVCVCMPSGVCKRVRMYVGV